MARDDHVLRAVCEHWRKKIEHSRRHKKAVYQDDADRAMSFYNGPRTWNELMMKGGAGPMEGDDFPDPTFKMRVNKAAEMVQLFGPSLYHDNPVRQVNARRPITIPPEFFPDPNYYQAVMRQEMQRKATDDFRANLLSLYLNWTPTATNLRKSARLAVDEALIKGRGCLWTELVQPPNAEFHIVGSSYDTSDNLFIDPDAESLEEAQWIARRCVHPVWWVEREYGLRPGSLRGTLESQAQQAEVDLSPDGEHNRKRGLTADLLVYFKIWSKMGIGGRLSGINPDFAGPLEMFGDYCFLVITKDTPYPLNLPPDLQDAEGADGSEPDVYGRIMQAVAWPIPFWAANQWPVSCLDFHPVSRSPWPMSHLKPAMGELMFLQWAMSFLVGKVRNTTRDFIACKKEAAEEIKTALLEGKDLTLLEIDAQHETVQEVIQILQMPSMNTDIWKVIAAVEQNFERRVGLTELMYGSTTDKQIRSAEEASIRSQSSNIRPNDMAECVEAWMTEATQKEAMASRLLLGPEDVRPIMGDIAAGAWGTFVVATDPFLVARQLEYRIEAGSTRKPNKDRDIANATEAIQTLLPVFQAYAQMTGDLTPLNNLLADFAKSRDMDPERYMLRAPMPVLPASTAGGESPEAAA
ncbi:MAG: hypothetical protein IRY99_07920 [Isosphaeraceae bacterium]|nr:hypothetical protein [Isosphaeraceae bacterium]